jgi:uncharacterized protein
MTNDFVIEKIRSQKRELQKRYAIKKIGLFGSFAKNTQKDDSDIDIVVQLEKQDLFQIIGIKQDLENEFHCTVDVVSYRDKMNPFLKDRIDREAIYV